ncbi:hypothetical protein GQ42DRAFT_80081 [Ramicandelaber brevisporus]|nr:hypothetical protein GQ42DRAFT_80081 [Ramicandelaber brevisporus]
MSRAAAQDAVGVPKGATEDQAAVSMLQGAATGSPSLATMSRRAASVSPGSKSVSPGLKSVSPSNTKANGVSRHTAATGSK